MAERVLAAGELLPVRDEVPDAVAAALGNSGMAALIALGFHGELAAGERVAIVGATGVAGRIALQLARARNADAIVGVGRRSPRLDALPARGATATVALDESDLGDAITRAAGGPVDVVVDFVGGSPGARAIAALGLHGRYVQVGSKAGATIEVPTALLRSRLLTLRGTAGFREPHDRRAAAYAELLDLAAAGRLAVDVTAIPLGDAAEAWRLPDGSADGKLVVLPPSIK
jgi:NADPH2:quinone reductase